MLNSKSCLQDPVPTEPVSKGEWVSSEVSSSSNSESSSSSTQSSSSKFSQKSVVSVSIFYFSVSVIIFAKTTSCNDCKTIFLR